MIGGHVFEFSFRAKLQELCRELTDDTTFPSHHASIPIEVTSEVRVSHRCADPLGSLVESDLLAAEPPCRLQDTVHAAFQPSTASLPFSRIRWPIVPPGKACKLTPTCSTLDSAGSITFAILDGWAMMLSSPKTLLEIGTSLLIGTQP